MTEAWPGQGRWRTSSGGGRRIVTGAAWLAIAVLGSSSPCLQAERGTGDPGRSVHKIVSETEIRVDYRWTDADGRLLSITLPISRADLELSEQALGFSLRELQAFLVQAEASIRKEKGLTALDIARTVVSEVSDPQWCRISKDPTSEFNFVMRTDAAGRAGSRSEIDRVIEACRRRWDASRKTVRDRLKRRLKDYAGAHGMQVTPQGIAVDYRRLVRDSAARLKPLADEFRRVFGRSNVDLFDALYFFVQSIPYRPVPPIAGERYSAGLSVPLRVLAEDRGDCDSKAILFAALWLNLSRRPTVLIRVPGHMLVGVAIPTVGGTAMTIQSRRYLLLELACPGPQRPGQIARYSADAIDAGDYRYLVVS